MKTDVLVFASHPDDAELNCGGIIASLTASGRSVGVIDLTRGEMGTRGTHETRQQEVEKASDILGLSYRANLDMGDSVIENNRENQLKIIQQVRHCRPDICITGAPFDRHPDHGKGTKVVLDALFYSGLQKIETDDGEGGIQSPWRPSHILHYMQDRPFEPDLVYDISEHWETKRKAMLAFESQFNISDPGEEPETYISSERYFKQIEARARYFGHLAGFEYGEPLKYYMKPMPVTDLDSLFKHLPSR